jgi:2Fe-2S ferredoxin
MRRITYVLPDGSERTVDALPARSIMLTALDNNIPGIAAECGGSCACATCHVYVDPAQSAALPPPDAMEEEMLGVVSAERRPESRLGCMLRSEDLPDGLIIRIPDRQY